MLVNNKFFLMTPMNISYMWNIGSLMGLMMILQIFTGLMMTMYFENSSMAFQSIWMLHLEVLSGSMMHFLHLNFASWIFFFLYMHMAKGLIFSSFLHMKFVWVTGWMIMMILMLIAFMGYVLPWGQMSLWGATVICNLLTTIPFVGVNMVQWIWGGYFVSIITLKLFFSFHFLMPLILICLIMIHIIMLHLNGSSNPLGSSNSLLKQEFMNSYFIKDTLNIKIILMIIIISFMSPYMFSDTENFIMSNPMISPIHIQPEWYFLSYYAILRAIPNKIGGVFCFLLSLILLLMLILMHNYQSLQIFKFWNFYYMNLMMIIMFLIFLGGCPVESPYLLMSQIYSLMYFFWFITIFI